MKVLLAGATGLVGRHCLKLMLTDHAFETVVVPTRRELPPDLYEGRGSSKLEEHIVDFERLSHHADLIAVDCVVCTLGTTIKKAGSKDAFRRVDYGYPVKLAELARAGGARRYLVVSALGADPGSMFFYNRVKGELEERLRELDFSSLTIVRPSLLLGERNEFRLGEEAAKRLSFLVPSRYKPVRADDVAGVLVNAAKAGRQGVEVIESKEIRDRAPVRRA